MDEKKIFENFKTRLNSIFDERPFEENPFKETFTEFLGFEFDFVFHEDFFEGLKNYLKKISSSSFVFYTLDPSPDQYFVLKYGVYNVVEVSCSATDKDLELILMKDPGDSPSDAIAISSDIIALFSFSNDWAIIGSREWEIAIVGFAGEPKLQQFVGSFKPDAQTMFNSIQGQTESLDEILTFNDQVKAEYNKLVKNYTNRAHPAKNTLRDN